MKKPHQQYDFSTFNERLAHVCTLLKIAPYPFAKDAICDPIVDQDALRWIKEHGVNMEWLFIGNPCSLIQQYASQGKSGGGLPQPAEKTAQIEQPLEQLDMALSHLNGVIKCLYIIASDLGCDDNSPANEAFFACLAGAESFYEQARTACDDVHRAAKR